MKCHTGPVSIYWWCTLSACVVSSLACPVHADERTVSFVNDVVPVLTKAGCNAGSCHAKAGGGQNGFQLSLLGFEPGEDYEHVVLEGRGRRLAFARSPAGECGRYTATRMMLGDA